MKLFTIVVLLTVKFGYGRPQVSEDRTVAVKNSVNAAAEARNRAVSAAKAANKILAESGSQAGTKDYIIGTSLTDVARSAANTAEAASKAAATGDRNSLLQLGGLLRQVTNQVQWVGSMVDGLLKSVLGPGTDGISGLLSGGNTGLLSGGNIGLLSGGNSGILSGDTSGLFSGGDSQISGSVATDSLTAGPLIEAVRTVMSTAGRANTAANAASATARAKTKAEAESKATIAKKAASDAETLVQQAESTAANTEVVPGTEITSKLALYVAHAVAAATEAVAEAAKSIAGKFSIGASPGSGIISEKPNGFLNGLLNPIFR